MRILALETSCDESAAAYLHVERGLIKRFESVVMTQAIHAKYGGVVPEVAAREHSVTLPIVLDALADKVTGKSDGRILGRFTDVVASTSGPGLVTSLKVGVETARSLAFGWNKKLIGVNHIDGHVSAAWLPGAPLEPSLANADRGVFPALVLVVSGGHTELLFMRGHGKYKLLGATRDDAAGEAFDKTAKLMGLGYPGGPAISRLAASGDSRAYEFPRPMLGESHHDFSFSGLKTAVRYFLEKHAGQIGEPKFMSDVAASAEEAIVETLVGKALAAAKVTRAKSVILAGGVAANGKLRRMLAAGLAAELPRVRYVEPPLAYCTDNAAMIAMAAYFMAREKRFTDPGKITADPHWELGGKRV